MWVVLLKKTYNINDRSNFKILKSKYQGWKDAWGINKKTNNGVEWLALIKGLELARKEGIEELAVFGDSCMVIGEARNLVRNIKNPITKTHQLLKCVAREFKAINFLHILRENNSHADRLANQGVDLECGSLLCEQQDQERNWIPL